MKDEGGVAYDEEKNHFKTKCFVQQQNPSAEVLLS